MRNVVKLGAIGLIRSIEQSKAGLQPRCSIGGSGLKVAISCAVLERPLWAAVSTGRGNTLIVENDWSVFHEVSSPHLLFISSTCRDLGSLAACGIDEFDWTRFRAQFLFCIFGYLSHRWYWPMPRCSSAIRVDIVPARLRPVPITLRVILCLLLGLNWCEVQRQTAGELSSKRVIPVQSLSPVWHFGSVDIAMAYVYARPQFASIRVCASATCRIAARPPR